MSVYYVTQWLSTKRTILIHADSEQEAKDKARHGYGEVLRKEKSTLLASVAEEDEDLAGQLPN